MVTSLTPGSFQSGLPVEATSESKSESKSELKVVDSTPNTQIPAPESTFITRCWDEITDAVLSILRVVSEVPKRVWDCVKPLFYRSVKLDNLQAELSKATTDQNRLQILLDIVSMTASEIDSSLDRDLINTRMLAAFDSCEDSLKLQVYKEIVNVVLDKERKFFETSARELVFKINGNVIPIGDPDFGLLVFRSAPCADRVALGLVSCLWKDPDEK